MTMAQIFLFCSAALSRRGEWKGPDEHRPLSLTASSSPRREGEVLIRPPSAITRHGPNAGSPKRWLDADPSSEATAEYTPLDAVFNARPAGRVPPTRTDCRNNGKTARWLLERSPACPRRTPSCGRSRGADGPCVSVGRRNVRGSALPARPRPRWPRGSSAPSSRSEARWRFFAAIVANATGHHRGPFRCLLHPALPLAAEGSVSGALSAGLMFGCGAWILRGAAPTRPAGACQATGQPAARCHPAAGCPAGGANQLHRACCAPGARMGSSVALDACRGAAGRSLLYTLGLTPPGAALSRREPRCWPRSDLPRCASCPQGVIFAAGVVGCGVAHGLGG